MVPPIKKLLLLIISFSISSKLENNLKTNRSTLIQMSFPTLDDNKSEYYPLRAGHIASRF